ncbi:Na+/proline symporter [Cyclonatronum proteinivorum]|uniref:histidine kinase n=1 Tax=Cyclonatronum proteinivorum TaxID=1457365 RepID=A0A345ULS6_9BACT|nr:sensor histidine kinase [Cyclonatronum proteinivorum]AXJ01428.1 Na+/proline symporter [Cyclonatronum proteinivorum]
MIQPAIILTASLLYLLVLFGIAYYADRRKEQGRSLIANPYIYALSLGVYCTAWTFFGSVGRAAESGVGFLPIYIGPTLMALLWWVVLRKMVRIAKQQRITSIADFVASRYGKSTRLSVAMTLITVVGIIPYIALQLKAISGTYLVLSGGDTATTALFTDTALYATLILAAFTILFGARELDATERHEGLVAAIAFESVVKLVAFLAVGIFVVWFVFDGPTDLWAQAMVQPGLQQLFSFGEDTIPLSEWFWLTLISMFAILFLPRQFQVSVVENVSEKHILKAIWLFPLYLFAINIFVIPIALAGLILFPGGSVDADTFVITIPLFEGSSLLALFAFIGGLSAATGMVIVAVVALSTMVSNDLLVPALVRSGRLDIAARADATGFLLLIRRVSIIVILLLAYSFVRFLDQGYSLVSIGLISFVAVAQFAPAILGGLFWKGASRDGALAGLLTGFGIWLFTLVLPTLETAEVLSSSITENGLFGLPLLQPYALFGVSQLDPISHAAFWSLSLNSLLFFGVSLLSRPGLSELSQASLFVDALDPGRQQLRGSLSQRTASREDVIHIMQRFLGPERTAKALEEYEQLYPADPLKAQRGIDGDSFINYAETLLGGVIGSASARTVVSSVAQEEPLGMEQIMTMLDETRQALAYSRELEEKSAALELTTAELKEANTRLRELDEMKDEFMFTVTHELKTPLTSIRAFTEILRDNPGIPAEKAGEFLDIITRETERLSRLITQILDMQRFEKGAMNAAFEQDDLRRIANNAVQATEHKFREKQQEFRHNLDSCGDLPMQADADQLEQVIVNLLANASKFTPAGGRISLDLSKTPDHYLMEVTDNGPGVPEDERELIFEKFSRARHATEASIPGTGLGLSIVKSIVALHRGTVAVTDAPDGGACFRITLPFD